MSILGGTPHLAPSWQQRAFLLKVSQRLEWPAKAGLVFVVAGRHKLTNKKSKGFSRAATKQHANEVAAIMSKAAAAFGRKANSQNLSLKSE